MGRGREAALVSCFLSSPWSCGSYGVWGSQDTELGGCSISPISNPFLKVSSLPRKTYPLLPNISGPLMLLLAKTKGKAPNFRHSLT